MSNSQKNFLSIRSKLIAAVAMLLVASFMVVSSTYAWFTLSTAPEVTGITTQVGANGKLEIALYTGSATIENSIGATNLVDKNKTWGNIIDLSDPLYGLSTIFLKPSVLALGTETTLDTTPLITPVYGSDGRVEKLSKNGFYGAADIPTGSNVFNGFVRNDKGGYGVRALGTASSMTPQQLQYANASSAVKNNLDAAYNAATASLVNNGSGLVTLILKGATDQTAVYVVVDDSDTPENENELAALGAMIDSLKQAPKNIETAIKNFMILKLAKDQEALSDNDFALLMGAFESSWTSIFTQLTTVDEDGNIPSSITVTVAGEEGAAGTDYTVAIPTEFQFVVSAYNDIAEQVTGAEKAYNDALDSTKTPSVTFTTVRVILENLMNVESLEINGETYDDIIAMGEDKASWAINALTKGIQMQMMEGSGVYASIASITQNIDVSFTAEDVSASYGNMSVKDLDLNIRMYTALETIVRLNPAVIAAPENKGAEADAVISDTYGYVLDFAFRTNAAGSNLLLQQAAKDRIYGDNTDTESETWGGGSYMSFTTHNGFGDLAVRNLMSHIRIVFADTLTGEIYACAGLDNLTATFDPSTSEVKAEIKLCTYDTKDLDEGLKTLDFTGSTFTESQAITSLGQNQIANVSVYVYLDGETVTNEDIAAFSNVTGKLNLQFASDAALKPMDYSDLQNQGNQNQNP